MRKGTAPSCVARLILIIVFCEVCNCLVLNLLCVPSFLINVVFGRFVQEGSACIPNRQDVDSYGKIQFGN